MKFIQMLVFGQIAGNGFGYDFVAEKYAGFIPL
jgi:hypothetical protein